MKRIKFNEIIECSSQQSILSGQAGFGIRTFTEGFNPELATKICNEVACAYEVSIAEQVTREDIVADPNVVTKFPRTIRYTAVKDEDKEWYVIACSTYVGIDYGYFCEDCDAQRAGSNYIADILVFDEKPTAELFHALIEQKVFLPVKNDCDPNNPELKKLLAGEPYYLQPREVEVKEAADETPAINEDTALVAMALLQTKINKDLGKDSSLLNIVFQAQEAKTPAILQAFGTLPNDLVNDKYFQTNYLQGYGMPNGYRMIFLNETNKEEVYINNYVHLNLDEKKFLNTDTENYYFGKVKEAAIANNHELFYALVNYLFHLSVQADTDYKFLFNLFIATETEKKLAIEELTEDFFTKAKKANMPADKLKKFITSVNHTLDETIQKEKMGKAADANCQAAMKVITYLYQNWKEVLSLDETSLQDLTNLWFVDHQLAKYVKEFGIEVIQHINTKDIAPEDFFESIKLVDSHDNWQRLVIDQFGEEYKTKHAEIIDTIIDTILVSAANDKNELIMRFFPVSNPDDKDRLASYIGNHPANMQAMQTVVEAVCKNDKALMLKFLEAGQFSASTKTLMRPIVCDYFRQVFSQSINEGITQLIDFARNINKTHYKDLGFPEFTKQYTEECYKYPKKANTAFIQDLLNPSFLAEATDSDCRQRLEFIYNLKEHRTNYMGTYRELLIAKRLDCSIADVRIKIVEKLFEDKAKARQELSTTHITEYFTDKYSEVPEGKTKEEGTLILDCLWTIFKNDPHTCMRCTPVILQSAKLSSKDRKEYLAKCHNEQEKAFITKYYGFWSTLKRKLFKK